MKDNISNEQLSLYHRVCDHINPDRLQNLIFDLTNIHSPTGQTKDISDYLDTYLSSAGFDSRRQSMSETSANVFAQKRGSGGGARVLLYCPIDTHLELDDEESLLTNRSSVEADMQPFAQKCPDWVFGLGASNPKGMAATLIEVAIAMSEAEVPLVGDLLLGFADGGMPVDISARNHFGMSNGVTHLLAHGASPDFAIVMKPWNWVYHEEPGMAWFKLRVIGTMGYAGVPRGAPGFRSSILPSTWVIEELESWILEYTEKNTSGQIKPYGWISGIRSGNPERPSFPSAVTEIFFDIRVNPRTSPSNVCAQFEEFINELKAERSDLQLEWEMYGAVAGGTTDPNNWIIKSCLRGWEFVEGRKHGDPVLLGGQTDGAALRRLGIPTARIGWPWPSSGAPLPVAEGLGGMGATFIPDLIPCAQKISYALIDTLTRKRSELGL